MRGGRREGEEEEEGKEGSDEGGREGEGWFTYFGLVAPALGALGEASN